MPSLRPWRSTSTAPAPPASKDTCFVAGAAYGDPFHPKVTFLRDVRDRQLPVGRGGRAFAAALNRCYAVLSPPIARRLQGHPAAGAAVRAGLLDPLVAVLRLVSRVTEGRPRLRAVLLATTFLAAAIVEGAIAAALGAALVLAAKGVR